MQVDALLCIAVLIHHVTTVGSLSSYQW
jgi:hypothetical protein